MNILLIILAFIAFLLILAAFMRKDYHVEEVISIQKPRDTVFSYLKMLRNQEKYNKWVMADLSALSYRGDDSKVGFVAAWDSPAKNVGKGEQEIMAIKENERIDLQIRFIRPFTGVAAVYQAVRAQDPQSTEVKWGMESRMKWPMNLMLPILGLEKKLKKDLRSSMENLKSILENSQN